VLVPSAGRVFSNSSLVLGQPSETWTTSSRKLRIDFSSPVTRVSIRALSSGPTSFGRLEIYDAAGNLLDRFTTGALTAGQNQLMTLSRGTADIAYAIARGHMGTEVVLDSLSWGPGASATSNTQGADSLGFLPPGSYRARVTAPPGNLITLPIDGVYTVNVSSGQIAGDLNFGIKPAPNMWHNFSNGLNVTGDAANSVNAIDVLNVINWLNDHPNDPRLPSTGNPAADGYVDVDNNGICNAIDVLVIINYLNSQSTALQSPTAPAEGDGAGEGQIAFAMTGTSPEGEISAAANIADDSAAATPPVAVAPKKAASIKPHAAKPHAAPLAAAKHKALPEAHQAKIEHALDSVAADVASAWHSHKKAVRSKHHP
jgi:hypothetical protein